MNNDDFWTTLATGHTNTVLPSAMDTHLSGKSLEESFGSVRGLTDKMREANALSLPVEAGVKVVFAGGMGAYLTYDDIPADGITGEVVTVKSATGEITHHEGKVFVKWDDGKFRPTHAEHLRLAGTDKTKGEGRTADLKADFEKIKTLAERKPDSKFLKSLLKQMADKGFAPTDKQMAVVKKIEDEAKEMATMQKELKSLDKKAAVPRGATQTAIMAYLDARSRPVALTSMVRDSSFHGVHFGKVMKAAEVLAKKGLIRYFSDPNEMKGYMLQRTASQYRVASLGDLTDFLKSADGKLIHKSTNDLWSYNKDADGNFLVSRLFDDEGEPLKG